jgi:predicted esterase
MATAHTIVTATHGRYLTEPPKPGNPAGLLVGFHGYGEPAEMQLERLRSIPGSERWLLVSIQGLHRFYNRRSDEVVASWMTRQDRELAIADNLAFVNSVVDAVARDVPAAFPLVFAGFSQGVAMAFRAAGGCPRAVAGIIAAGGDVPPELDRGALARIPSALLARGQRDEWYSPAKWTGDQARLRDAGVDLHPVGFDGGHEWHADVSASAGVFLQRLTRSGPAER